MHSCQEPAFSAAFDRRRRGRAIHRPLSLSCDNSPCLPMPANPPATQHLPTGRSLTLIAAALMAITLAAAGALMWDQRQAALARAQSDITDLGIVLAEQTARSLQAVDLVLRNTRAAVGAR